MRKGKHSKKGFKIIEIYSVLILIATLFMSVGYAVVSGVVLNVEGTAEVVVQDGIFISNVKYLSNVGANVTNSRINYYLGTMLDSEIVLGNTSQSSITYEVTIQNNTDKEQVFIDALYEESNYSNNNIELSLESIGELKGIEKYVTTIVPNGKISFPITFKYKEGANLNNNILQSKLNFRFKEKPILALSNEGENYKLDDIYPDYEPKEYEFTVRNYIQEETNIVPMNYYFEVDIDKPLVAKIYDKDGNEVTGNVGLKGQEQETQEYTLKIIWDNSNEEENIKYDSIEYANKEFHCNVVLKAKPDDEKYLDYTITKEFKVDITSSDYRKNFSISYVDISNNNYPSEIKEGEDLEITFINEIPLDVEVTGTDAYTYNNHKLVINDVRDNLVIRNPTGETIVFQQEGTVLFDGSNYIDTGIKLFSQENYTKDFKISFEVTNCTSTELVYSTLMSVMDETAVPYPGIVVRVGDEAHAGIYEVTANNLIVNNDSFYCDIATTNKFEFLRKDNILYVRVNEGVYTQINDYTDFTNYFDVPVTFGASLNAEGNPFRFFQGELSNIDIRYLTRDDGEYTVYEYKDEYVFDGTNYIDTGIQLFTEENINKNFEISFDIISYAEEQVGLATLLNSLSENLGGFPGILFRIGEKQYEVVANGNMNLIQYCDMETTTKFKFIKKNNILYYTINDGDMVELLNYEGFTNYFDTPITFGASIDAEGNPYRHFNGILSNIIVKISF